MGSSTFPTREPAKESLPAHVEHLLDQIGVCVVADARSTQNTMRVHPTPWKPTHPGEDPPF